jgi:tRNA threonylcarbamoyladenosine biosynthesis protein TsaE
MGCQNGGVHLATEADTLALGARLAGLLSAGDVVGLSGELGAGKTTLVRGLLRALGYEGEVRSPTFNLIQEFATEPPVCHVDLYRLETAAQVADLGLRDYGDYVTLVEWPERGSVEPNVWVRLSFSSDGGRDAVVEGVSL